MTTEEKPRRRTTWPAAAPLQQAADTLRAVAPDLTGPLANTLPWLAPYREGEGGYDMWEQAVRVAGIINGTVGEAVAK